MMQENGSGLEAEEARLMVSMRGYWANAEKKGLVVVNSECLVVDLHRVKMGDLHSVFPLDLV